LSTIDAALLREVIDKDEPRANANEIEMDEQCTNLIVRYQPRPKSLRLILMILDMTTELERVGDHAVNYRGKRALSY